jgi:hypothetical protein
MRVLSTYTASRACRRTPKPRTSPSQAVSPAARRSTAVAVIRSPAIGIAPDRSSSYRLATTSGRDKARTKPTGKI